MIFMLAFTFSLVLVFSQENLTRVNKVKLRLILAEVLLARRCLSRNQLIDFDFELSLSSKEGCVRKIRETR